MATEPTETTTQPDRSESNTAPGPLPERLYGDLPDFEFNLWKTDTQTIMAAVFLALGFTVTFQVVERIDVALTGGTFAPVATFFHPFFVMTGSILFGLSGGLIVANVNPLVSNLTASGAIAPVAFFTNTFYAVPMALFTWYFKEPGKGLTFKQVVFAHLIADPIELLPILFLQIYILELSVALSLRLYAIQVVIGYAAIFFAYPFLKKLLEAGVIPGTVVK